jgi:hypothetical protein
MTEQPKSNDEALDGAAGMLREAGYGAQPPQWTPTETLLNQAADMLEHWPLNQTSAERARFARVLRERATVINSWMNRQTIALWTDPFDDNVGMGK